MDGLVPHSRRSFALFTLAWALGAIALAATGIVQARDAGDAAAADAETSLLASAHDELTRAAQTLSELVDRCDRREAASLPVGFVAYEIPFRWPAMVAHSDRQRLRQAEHAEVALQELDVAIDRYRALADAATQPSSIRAEALWNLARIERDVGRTHEARRLLDLAAKMPSSDDSIRLRVAFDLAQITGVRGPLCRALTPQVVRDPTNTAASDRAPASMPATPTKERVDRFPAAPPRERTILLQRLDGSADARRPLIALEMLLAQGLLGQVRVHEEPSRCYVGVILHVAEDSVVVAVADEGNLLRQLIPSFQQGLITPADDGDVSLRVDPIPVAFKLGDAAVPRIAQARADAEGPRRNLSILLGSLLLVAGGWFAKGSRRQRALDDRQREFVAAVTHELKTPLSNILLYAETLRTCGADDPDQVPRFARTIQDEAERLRLRIQQVLDVASGRRRRLPTSTTFDPAELAEAVGADYQKGALDRQMRIAVIRPDQCPRVTGDPELLAQALGVLLDNAIRYAAHGVVSMVVGATSNRVTIRVRDQGPGIPAVDRERVFQPFVRLGSTSSHDQPGTGLGLSLARQCVEQLGGSLTIEDESSFDGPTPRSAYHAGALFLIQLPTEPSR